MDADIVKVLEYQSWRGLYRLGIVFGYYKSNLLSLSCLFFGEGIALNELKNLTECQWGVTKFTTNRLVWFVTYRERYSGITIILTDISPPFSIGQSPAL